MPAPQQPLELERASWVALSQDGAAAEFFADRLDPDVVMMLPGGLVLRGYDDTLRAMSGPAWASYQLEDVSARDITADVCLVTYAVIAARPGRATYSALMSSLWVRRAEGWRLALHQQTPR